MRPELIGPEFDVVPEKFLNKIKEEQNEHLSNNKQYRDFTGELLGRPDWVIETDNLQRGDR